MNDITLFPADIAAMSVSQLAALPAAQKAEIDKNLDEALSWLKKARTKFDAALDVAYGEQARAANFVVLHLWVMLWVMSLALHANAPQKQPHTLHANFIPWKMCCKTMTSLPA